MKWIPYAVAVLQWIGFTILHDRRRRLELSIYGLVGGLLEMAIMFLGLGFHWWDFTHFEKHLEVIMDTVVSLSIYCVQTMLINQYIISFRSAVLLIAGVSALDTLGEAFLLRVGYIDYMNGWNIQLTLVSYLAFFIFAVIVCLPYRRAFKRPSLCPSSINTR